MEKLINSLPNIFPIIMCVNYHGNSDFIKLNQKYNFFFFISEFPPYITYRENIGIERDHLVTVCKNL